MSGPGRRTASGIGDAPQLEKRESSSMLRRLTELTTGLRALLWSTALNQEEFVKRLLASEPKYQDLRNLNRFEHRMFSQGGEDGILREVFRRIGETNRVFVELGSGDGLENNTATLLLRGWTGHWVDCSRRCVARIRSKYRQVLDRGTLTIERGLVTAENVEQVLSGLGLPEEPDLLSIDIDGNDYWVWRAIASRRPRVVVIEYNALFQPNVKWVMAYASRHRWTGTTYFGASLRSLVELGGEKGYRLVGCTLSGTNAFFVREDLVADRFQEPFTAERHWEPARYALTVSLGHRRDFGEFIAKL
jgi:hypothetical protein